MRVSVSADVAEKALAHWQASGGPPSEGILLRRMLMLTCSVYDWSAAHHGRAQIAQLQADCGLSSWDAQDPTLAPVERVHACLQQAQARYDALPEAERGLSPAQAVRELGACA